MSDERSEAVYRVLRAVLDRPAIERRAFLDAECATDVPLRQEVQSLLDACDAAGDFLEHPPADVGTLIRTAELEGGQISHYRLERLLGMGGMGRVYLAQDLALGRPVALKVLRDAFSPWQRQRLLREAEASAKLQHPAIATFFESGESDGVAFIAMEYVAGRTLRERLKEGALPREEALAVAICLLEALNHAHAAKLLHRDIKPENIMLTGPRSAKLLDFGIAKPLMRCGEAAAPTGDSTLRAGTAGYMSPEQVRGEPLDARSDLFAVGSVLFEMLCGRPAFAGTTPTERMAAILTQDALPRAILPLPPELEAVVTKALCRDREGRYPSAAAFLSDLRCLVSEPAVAQLPQTLAVLGFTNVSGDPDDQWIGSGLAENLAAELMRVPGVTVLPRMKVLLTQAQLAAAGASPTPVELASMLGCRWALAGTVHKAGQELHLTAELLEVPVANRVFSRELRARAAEFFELQEKIASATVDALRLGLRGAVQGGSAPRLEAFECYMRGRQLLMRHDKGAFDQAIELFEQAVRLDPSYPLPLIGLAAIHALRFPYDTDPRDLDATEGYARRALQLDPDLGEPHSWLGYALMRRQRPQEALAAAQHGADLAPGDFYAMMLMGMVVQALGCHAESIVWHQRCLQLNPYTGYGWMGLGCAHMELGHFAEARWSLRKCVECEYAGTAGFAGSESFLAECLRRMGDLPEARRTAMAGLAAAEKSDYLCRDTARGVAYCVLGRTALQQGDLEAARVAFRQAVQHLRGRPRTIAAGHLMAQALAGLTRTGEGPEPLDQALRMLESREGFSFHGLPLASDDVTLLECARAAQAIGRADQTQELLAKARKAGASEPL